MGIAETIQTKRDEIVQLAARYGARRLSHAAGLLRREQGPLKGSELCPRRFES